MRDKEGGKEFPCKSSELPTSLLYSQTLHKLFAYGLELDSVSAFEYHSSEEIVDSCSFPQVVLQTDGTRAWHTASR
jgi:hypothetical protein